MTRFLAWLAIGLAAAFLVVANESFAQSTTVWLAFAIGIGTLIVSAIVALTYRDHGPSVAAALLCAGISAWTIAASRAFTHATVHHLILASALALSAVAILGLTAHELAVERRAHMGGMDGSEGERNLAAA